MLLGLDAQGLKQMYLLAFIQIETRQVWVSPCTLHPNREWMAQQARNFLMHVDEAGLEAGQLKYDSLSRFPARLSSPLLRLRLEWSERQLPRHSEATRI